MCIHELSAAWEPGNLCKLRIVEDPRADREMQVLGPPLYLETNYVTHKRALIRWVRPQSRNHGAPPDVSYKIQWKRDTGSWDTTPDVSEEIYLPKTGEEWASKRSGG